MRRALRLPLSLLLFAALGLPPAHAGTPLPEVVPQPAFSASGLSDAARAALQDFLAEQAGVPGAEAFVGDVRAAVPAGITGPVQIVRVAAEGMARSGRGVPFALFVRDGRGDVREVRATADVSLLVPVVVSARNMPAGAVIEAGDIVVRKRELASGSDDFLHQESAAVGKRARWQLSGGVPVRRDYVEDPDALRRGDPVLIVAESGPIRITGKGISLQGGRVGETVLVRNVSSGRELSGRLQAGGVVRVD